MRKTWPLVVLLVAAAAVPTACSKKQPTVPTMTVDAGAPVGDGGLAEAGLGDAGMVAIADGGAPDAAPVASGSASASPSASAAVGAALDIAIDTLIQAAALKNAPGMTLEGTINHQTVTEGSTTNQVITMQPGRCYTVIAQSAPTQVSTLEVKLLAPPLFTVEAGRSGATDKNPAILGRGKAATCPVLPLAIPYRIDTTARKGAGRVGIAVYSKAK